ncbi:MAG TPA: hypothetical protein VHN78_04120, partial [Chloroflexota bacterium]|nr:hypothetical protein [Chloroflexota bacterium]
MTVEQPGALSAERWQRAGRRLLSKVLSELAYEELLTPLPLGGGRYRLDLAGGVSYTFTARRRLFASWRVDERSIERHQDQTVAPAGDPLRFILDAYQTIGIPP